MQHGDHLGACEVVDVFADDVKHIDGRSGLVDETRDVHVVALAPTPCGSPRRRHQGPVVLLGMLHADAAAASSHTGPCMRRMARGDAWSREPSESQWNVPDHVMP